MQDKHATLESPSPTRQLREELPGSWYNYELSKDADGIDHWLSSIDVSEFAPQRHFTGRAG